MQYSVERNAQIIISLLKQHSVRKIIVSPGTTNIPIVASLQNDSFFEVYSSVDERSAAYIACGLSATSGEPVALSCTGATASRNYLPGLTEAYYRNLPVIAITSFNGNYNIGQLLAQNIDRNSIPNDVAKLSVQVPKVKDEEDAAYVNRVVNNALLESIRYSGGPVHINVDTSYNPGLVHGEVPKSRLIERYTYEDAFPELSQDRKIIIHIGSHRPFSDDETEAISLFVKTHNAAVFCDNTSNYQGFGKILSTLSCDNTKATTEEYRPSLVIFVGDTTGDYPTANFLVNAKCESWRVSLDGEVRDRFGTLSKVFQCSEKFFFEHYSQEYAQIENHYLSVWQMRDAELRANLPDLPFSCRWIASQTAPSIPKNSIVHCAILNSLRSMNYYPMDSSIRCFSNTGGFGIDGALSTTIGSCLAEPDTEHYCITGDLAFFYDMNVLGNRHLCNNLHILLINNGVGNEMHMSYSIGSRLGDSVFKYVAAGGHYRSKDTTISAAESWARTMGFTYLSASSKDDFMAALPLFCGPSESPILFECFTDPENDALAGKMLTELNPSIVKEKQIKQIVKNVLPENALSAVKRIIRG